MIEEARKVQSQSARAEKSLPSPPPSGQTGSRPEMTIDIDPARPKKPEYLGPLLPDHLREASRRYKKNGEGGGAGMEGTSLGLGISGSGAMRLGGKRLFR